MAYPWGVGRARGHGRAGREGEGDIRRHIPSWTALKRSPGVTQGAHDEMANSQPGSAARRQFALEIPASMIK